MVQSNKKKSASENIVTKILKSINHKDYKGDTPHPQRTGIQGITFSDLILLCMCEVLT
jgi:hypothetical protein